MQRIKRYETAHALVFLLVDAADHVTGKTGLTPSLLLSKNGAAFAAPAGSVAEIGHGLYRLTPTSADTGTLGVLTLRATAAGADPAYMAYQIAEYNEADLIAEVQLLPEDTADAVRVELSTEMMRLDVEVSSRNAIAPPTAASIADAVCDEPLGSHTTAGTVGAALIAAGASGDPWASLVPASYADGTAGAALGRLNNTPATDPVIILPAPPTDADLCTVYIDVENLANTPTAGLSVIFELVASGPAKTERALVLNKVAMVTGADGRASMHLQRNDRITPAGTRYLVSCKDLNLQRVELVLNTSTRNLLDLIG